MNPLKIQTLNLTAALRQCGRLITQPARFNLGICLAMIGGLLPVTLTAQTIKPFQARVEVAAGFNGTLLLTNNVMRVGTNGATSVVGGNWVISDVLPTITGAPNGVTASYTDSSGNQVTDIPVVLSTANASLTTNLIVKLVFDGTQTGTNTVLNLNLPGGVTNGYFPLGLEIGRIWNGNGNAAANGAGNWSDTTKWGGGAIPGANDAVVFMDIGAQTNSLVSTATSTNYLTNIVVDTSSVISSLRFGMTNLLGTPATNFHNLYIKDNVNLAIKGAGGFSMLRDYTYETVATGTKMSVTIYGTNGTLIQTNENSNFSMLIDGQGSIPNSVLDMSGLGNLQLNVNRVAIGDILAYPGYLSFVTNAYSPGSTMGSSRPSKCLPNWKMAMTNIVRSVYVDPNGYSSALSRSYAMEIGRNETTGGSSGNYGVSMGYTNAFYLDGLCVAGYASLGGSLNFLNPNSYALFRNTNGGRMTIIALGDAAGSSTTLALGNNTKCGNTGFGVDFTKSYVDVLVDRFYMSMDRGYTTGGGVSQSSLGMSAGIFDANSAFIGYQATGNQTNQNSCSGALTVSNTAIFKVNGTLALGYTTASIGDPSTPASTKGTLTVGPGGTVLCSNITVGGVTKASTGNAISMIGNGTLVVSNRIADASANGALGTLAFSGGNNTIKLFIDGSNPSALIYVTNFTSTGTGNKLAIGGVKNLTYPADVVIIQGAGSPAISAASFDAGVTMPAGSGLSGTLTTSSTNSINLHIINRLPNNLVWRGTSVGGQADWDYTTKNWLDRVTGLLTNFDNPDVVAFDNTAGYATNINLAGATPFTPGAINMTNNSLQYTFLGSSPNSIIGNNALNKYGTGTVEIDANVGVSLYLNQGVMTGNSSGAIGNANVASGAVMNFAGNMSGSLASAGVVTTAGTITGTLTAQSGSFVTNSGTVNGTITVLSGGLLFNSGSLNNVGAGSSGAPQVASGGTLINSGTIGANNAGNILYVNGTFDDLGGMNDNITVQSVTIGAGGTFIPGGSGIGLTTINTDSTGTFPGALLLVQGSTNIFQINTGSNPSNSVVAAAHLSFGNSASQQTQAGATLLINNAGGPLIAGQTFQLFNNTFSSGTAPYSTGASTNTFPVVTPAPGAGLSWDLRHLWAPDNNGNSGYIAVVGSGSGPVLTNSFAGDGTGTNIVGQFAWDSSYAGYRLQSLVTPITAGLAATNRTGISGSWTNTVWTVTNVLGTNCVFYRLVFP